MLRSQAKAIRNALVALCAMGGTAAAWAQDIVAAPNGALQASHLGSVTALAFSQDGKLLAGDGSGNIQAWELADKLPLGTYHASGSILFLAFLGGDRTFLAVDRSGLAQVFDPAHGAGASFHFAGRPLRVALDAGLQFLAVATKQGKVEFLDLKTMTASGLIDAGERVEEPLFLGFDRLGQQLVAINKYAKVSSWNPRTLKLIRDMQLSTGDLDGSRPITHSAATNRQTNVFAVGLEEVALSRGRLTGGGGLVRNYSAMVFDWSTGMEVKRIKLQDSLEQMAMGPGNDHVATLADESKDITLIDLRKGEVGSSIHTPSRPTALAVSEDNHWLAAGNKSGEITTWKLAFKAQASGSGGNLPTLAGRIRTTSGTNPAMPSDTPVRLAIMDFQAKGVDPSVAEICLDSLHNSLANHPWLTLIERKKIQDVLKEQKFQASSLTDDATSVKLGNLLNADHILFCSIGKLGSTLVLSARLLNVETGKIVQGREVICEECRDQDIFDAVKLLADTLAR